MRAIAIRIMVLLVLTRCAAMAQSNDIGILIGGAGPSADVVIGTSVRVSSTVAVSLQLNYAFQVMERKPGALGVELPLVLVGHLSVSVNGGVSAASRNTLFFTPGIRFSLPLHSRVALYGVAGGGVGSFGNDEVIVGPVIGVQTRRVLSGVFDFGGGIDLRLTHLLSLRGEARDFVSRAGLGGTAGRNHGIFQGGIGFRF
ncbi:MAG: hypothetical protein ABSH28_23480 [Acidobacteriota bacterium]|jgi:hypothetical protein